MGDEKKSTQPEQGREGDEREGNEESEREETGNNKQKTGTRRIRTAKIKARMCNHTSHGVRSKAVAKQCVFLLLVRESRPGRSVALTNGGG